MAHSRTETSRGNIRPLLKKMANALFQAKTIDEVLQFHQNFLDSTLKECMLTNEDLHRVCNDIGFVYSANMFL